jgi:hypothetical protein
MSWLLHNPRYPLPIITSIPWFQRFFVKGIMLGAVKG